MTSRPDVIHPRMRSYPARRRVAVRGSLGAAAAVAALVAAFMIATGAGTPQPYGVSGTWTLVFKDDFNRSSLDRSKWEPDRYGKNPGQDPPFDPRAEDAWFNQSNVSVRDGKLAITLRSEPRTLAGRRYRFSSGVVQTQQHYLLQPGAYIEARIKVPDCDGCWPAFWTAPPNVWPPELDIFEFFGTGVQSRPKFNYHLPDGGAIGPFLYGKRTTDYRHGFHVYGMSWDGYQAVPHVDGDAYAVGARSGITKLPQAIILNLSVQAGHDPRPGAQMLVDWVRVWRPGSSP